MISPGNKILCDAFRVRSLGNRSIFVLCDGCGWGPKSRDAAQTAASAFVDYLSDASQQAAISDTSAVKLALRTALDRAHDAICKRVERLADAGQCTLIGGMLCQVRPPYFMLF